MNLLSAVSGAVGVIVVALIGYFGARLVQRATAAKLRAEGGLAEATADKTAVDGYDLLTGRLEARLKASEDRETELLQRLDASEDREEQLLERLRDAERTIGELRAEVGSLRRQLTAYIQEEPDA